MKTSFFQMLLSLGLLVLCLGANRSMAADTFASCVPTQVMAFSAGSKRVHVKCASALAGIQWFALLPDDVATTARVLSILSTAQVAGRTLTILYDPADIPGASTGCAASNCRLLRAVGFGN